MRTRTTLAATALIKTLASTCIANPADEASPPRLHLDHIILGVADLDRGTDQFEQLTGVRPAYGGKHPFGTHNALVSLGDRTYLELIAVQPGAKSPAGMPDFAKFEHSTPFGWAVSAADETSLRKRLEDAGFQITAPQPGSRTTPAGAVLRWQTFGLAPGFGGAPFFIIWAPEVEHPSTTSPIGCTLERMEIPSSDAEAAARFQRAFALPVTFGSKDAAMTVTLSCPKGTVVFSPSEPTIHDRIE